LTVYDKEHYDLMATFERAYSGYRPDREPDKKLWAKGQLYENGETNALFRAYRDGYALGKISQ
jgi:hypothetical protein